MIWNFRIWIFKIRLIWSHCSCFVIRRKLIHAEFLLWSASWTCRRWLYLPWSILCKGFLNLDIRRNIYFGWWFSEAERAPVLPIRNYSFTSWSAVYVDVVRFNGKRWFTLLRSKQTLTWLMEFVIRLEVSLSKCFFFLLFCFVIWICGFN